MINYRVCGSVRSYAELPEGAKVESVNGKDAVGNCEGCSKYIFFDSDYYLWEDGVYTCAKCGGPEESL